MKGSRLQDHPEHNHPRLKPGAWKNRPLKRADNGNEILENANQLER